MSSRDHNLQELSKLAADLPDEELARLESFANYLKSRNKPPIIDRRLDDLRLLAEEKGSVLYAILFREAGIGLQWWEEERAGTRPEFPRVYKQEEARAYLEASQEWNKRGLVIYGYYPTLSEAIAREWERLEEME